MTTALRMAFFGSSLVSSYWNGAATYYRGILSALAARGWQVTFFEPDAYERQAHRDMPDPDWARVVVYPGDDRSHLDRIVDNLQDYDVLVKASGVGVFDTWLEAAIPAVTSTDQACVFWDVDAPATLDRLAGDAADAFHQTVRSYDLVITYGGGPPVVDKYVAFGAQRCVPIYNALDPATHFPVPVDPRFHAQVTMLANRLPDREARIDDFFFNAALELPHMRFLLGGSGWQDKPTPGNVSCVGHVGTRDHNAFNSSPMAVLSVNRASMASHGFSPATRIFEAAGAGACIVTDAWNGLDLFLEPGTEVLVAEDGHQVAEHLQRLDEPSARTIGRRALARVRAEHTYAHRVHDVECALGVI